MITLLVILAFVAVVCIIVVAVMGKGLDPNDRYESRRKKVLKFVRNIVVGACAVIAVLAMLIGGIKVVDQTEIGVVKTFGKVDHTISGGLNFVNPISDKVKIMDLRIHVRQSEFATYTKDAQPVSAAIEYQYELLPSQAMQVATQFGSYEILETKLNAVVEERVKIVFARYGAMSLLENRSTPSAEVRAEVEELEADFPVNFTSVVVQDLDFSDAFEAAVEAKMEAEQNALRAENEKQEAITRAEQAREVAAIEAEAAVTAAEGESKALEITRAASEVLAFCHKFQDVFCCGWQKARLEPAGV